MKKLSQKQLKSKGFICTDASEGTEQWVRKISETNFEVYERALNVMNEVDLTKYTDVELESQISAYYDSLEDLRKMYGKDSNMIISECISEQEFN